MSTPSITGLTPSFIGSSTVLNDGSSANVLTVALTNGNMQQGTDDMNISITPELNLAFYFIADANAEDGKKTINDKTFELNWALASKANIDGIVPHLFLPGESINYSKLSNQQRIPAGWKINSDNPNINLASLSTLLGWTISPPAGGYTLKPGQSLILVVTNVISDLPDGPSLAYMAYDNKHFIKCGPLQKTPNFVSGQKVGIGTSNPIYPLSIRTNLNENNGLGPKISLWDGGNSDEFYGFSISGGSLNYQVFTDGGHYFRAGGNNDDGRLLMAINDDNHDATALVSVHGSLGIGIPEGTYPRIKLAIGEVDTGLDHDAHGGLSLKIADTNRFLVKKNGDISVLGSQLYFESGSADQDHIFSSKTSAGEGNGL
ncbi:MAG: hypothetical protein R3B47_07360 [Bacteroidia bacterium]